MKKTQPVTTVLVVDDEQAIRRVQRRILEREGYQVREVGNGAEAIALLADDAPIDLLIADLEMPEVKGEEMARRFRMARPDQKILYVSGVVDRMLDERQMLWEGEAYLRKPFTPTGLSEAVALLLFGRLRRQQ